VSTTTIEGYATALYEVAKSEGALNAVGNELSAFAQAMQTSPELQRTLVDQMLPVERRQTVVTELLGAKAHPVTVNLLSMIVGANRVRDLQAIVEHMRGRAASDQSRVAGEVRSAHPMNAEQQERLTNAVSKQMGKPVALTFLVDPSLIGGVVTTVGDTIMDGSVRRRLEQMKDAV
jgi:F-type H+-transporting ATPase subunit delta